MIGQLSDIKLKDSFVLMCFILIIQFFNCSKKSTNPEPIPAPDIISIQSFDSLGGAFLSDIHKAIDTGYIICGRIDDPYGYYDALIAQIGISGEILWKKTFGGDGYDWAYRVKSDNSSGYLIAADFQVPLGQSHETGTDSYDAYFIHLDNKGNTLFEKKYDKGDHDHGISSLTSSDSSFLLLINADITVWLVNIRKNGDILWQSEISDTFCLYPEDMCYAVDSGFIIAGYTMNNANAGGFIMKVSPTGTKLVINKFPLKYFYSVQQAINDGYICVGKTDGPIDNSFVLKLDNDLKTQWSKEYSAPNYFNSYLISIQTYQSEYLAVGTATSNGAPYSQAILTRLSTGGEVVWSKHIGDLGNSRGNALTCSNDTIAIAGFFSTNNISNGLIALLSIKE